MSTKQPFKLKPLPYAEDALEPAIGRETVSIHYHKHHGGYVSKLNDALAGKGAATSLEAVIANARKEQDQKVYNLAAQIWNHDFYWASMTPERTAPGSILNGQIERRFSSIAKFEEAFKAAAENQFGSGWTWLCWDIDQQKLEVRSTTDAVIPPLNTHVPLLTLDVWEHAYYLDYRNDRSAYIEQFLERLINWDAVGERLTDAVGNAADAGLRRAAR